MEVQNNSFQFPHWSTGERQLIGSEQAESRFIKGFDIKWW